MTKLEIIDTDVKLPNIEDYTIYTYRLTMNEKSAKYLKKLIEIASVEEGEQDTCLVSLFDSLRGVKE